MRRNLALLVCALSIFLVGCASHSAAKAERRANENEARAAALHWLQLLDTGDYEEAFEWEAQDFRMARTQKQFVRYFLHLQPLKRAAPLPAVKGMVAREEDTVFTECQSH